MVSTACRLDGGLAIAKVSLGASDGEQRMADLRDMQSLLLTTVT